MQDRVLLSLDQKSWLTPVRQLVPENGFAPRVVPSCASGGNAQNVSGLLKSQILVKYQMQDFLLPFGQGGKSCSKPVLLQAAVHFFIRVWMGYRLKPQCGQHNGSDPVLSKLIPGSIPDNAEQPGLKAGSAVKYRSALQYFQVRRLQDLRSLLMIVLAAGNCPSIACPVMLLQFAFEMNQGISQG
jgi:hypothetical protein